MTANSIRANSLWVERLALTNFRSYASANVVTDAGPQVIVGANGSGKTNLLEALSLLSPGQGLRRVPFSDLARANGDGSFAVSARAHTLAGPADIGTGLRATAARGGGAVENELPSPSTGRGRGWGEDPGGTSEGSPLDDTPTPNPSPQGGGESGRNPLGGTSERGALGRGSSERAASERGRLVRIDGTAQSGSGVLADYLEIVWVTPAMDGLFTGAASDRRRFLDRLILCFDHGYRTIAGRFERAMTSRNRLLSDGVRDNAQLSGFERVMAENGIAVAAARLEAVAAMAAIVEKRRARDPNSAFPWSVLRLEGSIEDSLQRLSAVEAEDALCANAQRDARARPRRVADARWPASVRPRSSSTDPRRSPRGIARRESRKRCCSGSSWRMQSC